MCSKYCFNYLNIFCKNKLAKIKEKVIIKFKTYNISNFKLIIFKEKSDSNILDNNLDNFSKLKN